MLTRMLPLFALAFAARAEFLEMDIRFESSGCLPCVESLEGRLERVRGVDSVTVDPDGETINVRFRNENRVRLIPFLGRITQDGTRLLEIEATVRGSLERRSPTAVLTIAGSGEDFEARNPPAETTSANLLVINGRFVEADRNEFVFQIEPGSATERR